MDTGKDRQKAPKEKRKYSRAGSICWALGRLWGIDRAFLFFMFANVPLSVLYPLVQSYFPKVLIDRISGGAGFRELVFLCAGFLAAIVFVELLQCFMNNKCLGREYYPTRVYQMQMEANENFYADYEHHQRQDYQEICGYAKEDSCRGDCSPEYFWQDLSALLVHVAGIAAYVSLLTVLDPILFAAVALVSAASYFTARWQNVYYEKNKHRWEKEVRKKWYIHKFSRDFSLAKDIKLYGLEGWLTGQMQGCQDFILMWVKRCSLRELWASLLSGGMALLQDGAAYLVLITALLGGHVTVGEFVFYFGLVRELGGFLQGIITDVAKVNNRADKIAHYRAFFDYPNHFNHGAGCALPDGPVTIELRDVWYRYDGAEEDTLKGVTLSVAGGERLALVGRNGAGKTTLVKLICGLYAPTKGEILVNGRRIEEYNIEEYYSLISAVFQEIKIPCFTVFEFVASADLERPAAREDAEKAMRAAGIYERIAGLANGMDTHLGKGIYDDGVDLSGGETQKLVLARAIYKDGPLLVLDEPTAALDPIAENNLYLQYQKLTEGKTSIYISHRFASTRFCDRIVLLEDGMVGEVGSHEELMEKGGQYAYMFGVQSQYYREGYKEEGQCDG